MIESLFKISDFAPTGNCENNKIRYNNTKKFFLSVKYVWSMLWKIDEDGYVFHIIMFMGMFESLWPNVTFSTFHLLLVLNKLFLDNFFTTYYFGKFIVIRPISCYYCFKKNLLFNKFFEWTMSNNNRFRYFIDSVFTW